MNKPWRLLRPRSCCYNRCDRTAQHSTREQSVEPTPRLRPMSISDMLDAAFRLYRRHFLTFIGIVALLQVPMAILQFAAQLPFLQAMQRFTASPPVLAPGASPLDIFP